MNWKPSQVSSVMAPVVGLCLEVDFPYQTQREIAPKLPIVCERISHDIPVPGLWIVYRGGARIRIFVAYVYCYPFYPLQS